MSKGPFPFQTTSEAWEHFNGAARMHFIRLLKQEAEHNPDIKEQAKALHNKDYCARLLYILNMYAHEGNTSSEFDLDWAMLMAKPLSASQARRAIDDLIAMKLITRAPDIERNIKLDERNTKLDETTKEYRQGFKRGRGGKENRKTKFDFD
jgi:hypothetical protein